MNERELKQIARWVSNNLEISFDDALDNIQAGIKHKSCLILDNIGICSIDEQEFRKDPAKAVVDWWFDYKYKKKSVRVRL